MTDNECGQGMDSVLDDLLFLRGLLLWTMSFDAHLTRRKVMPLLSGLGSVQSLWWWWKLCLGSEWSQIRLIHFPLLHCWSILLFNGQHSERSRDLVFISDIGWQILSACFQVLWYLNLLKDCIVHRFSCIQKNDPFVCEFSSRFASWNWLIAPLWPF